MTKFGWLILSPGVETESCYLNYVRKSTENYDKLCSLDVLGRDNKQGGEQNKVYKAFKEQLERSQGGGTSIDVVEVEFRHSTMTQGLPLFSRRQVKSSLCPSHSVTLKLASSLACARVEADSVTGEKNIVRSKGLRDVSKVFLGTL